MAWYAKFVIESCLLVMCLEKFVKLLWQCWQENHGFVANCLSQILHPKPFPCEALAFFQILQILKLILLKNIQSQIQTVMFVDYVFWKEALLKCSNNVDNVIFHRFFSQMLHPKQFRFEQCESIFSNLKIFDTHIGQEHLITLFNSLILKRSFTKNPSLGKMMTIRTLRLYIFSDFLLKHRWYHKFT